VSAGLRVAALLLALANAPLAACDGRTVYLGDDPEADGGDDAGPPLEPCREAWDCDDEARPFCNYESRRCVECLDDWQCESGRCRNEARAGECVPAP
jgi:hypothetical protein